MSIGKGPVGRAPSEHLEPCYGHTCNASMVRTKRGGEYTRAQARELVLTAVCWLRDRGWPHPDARDLQTYGPALQGFDRGTLQSLLDDLVRTEDLTFTLLTPPHCHRQRPCYSPAPDYYRGATDER